MVAGETSAFELTLFGVRAWGLKSCFHCHYTLCFGTAFIAIHFVLVHTISQVTNAQGNKNGQLSLGFNHESFRLAKAVTSPSLGTRQTRVC